MAISTGQYDAFPRHDFLHPSELDGATPRHRVVIVGAGPVGLTLAAGLRHHGIDPVLIEPRGAVSWGSRAIALSRRSLEIWDHFGVAGGATRMGLGWASGRSFWRDREVLHFTMPDANAGKHPPMTNLSQCWAEQCLLDAMQETGPALDMRWHSSVVGLSQGVDGVTLRMATPQGEYDLRADYVVGCDGARSFVRQAVGLKLEGNSYEGRYLIADIVHASDAPTERRAWFDPPSNPGSTVLMHRQPGGVWRIDYQLNPEDDDTEAQQESAVRARIDAHLAMLGETPDYDLIMVSLYKAHCLTAPSYRVGRVLLAGDAGHLVPIFGVRGLNSGIDDCANLAWKLAAVLDGRSDALLDSYSTERVFAARENIRNGRKSTLFMTPPSRGHALLRDAALSLAVSQDFARPLVNPRQSTSIQLPLSNWLTEDDADWKFGPAPGAVLPNLRLADGFLLDQFGRRPVLLSCRDVSAPDGIDPVILGDGAALGLGAGGWYLIRPDGHVAARGQSNDRLRIAMAVKRMWSGT